MLMVRVPPDAPDQALPRRWPAIDLRGQLLLSFSLFVVIAAVIAFGSLQALRHTGGLAIGIYDGPLMTIDYARSAAQKFQSLAAASGSADTATGGTAGAIHDQVEDIAGDLTVVAQRSPDSDSRDRANQAADALDGWSKLAAQPSPDRTALGHASAALEKDFQRLVDGAEADGFRTRVAVVREIDRLTRLAEMVLAVAILLGGAFAAVLAGRMSRPIRDAIKALDAISGGNLKVEIPEGARRRDELGALIRAIAEFRDKSAKLRALEADEALHREAELARRRAEQARVAGAFEAQMQSMIHKLSSEMARLREQAVVLMESAEVAANQTGAVVSSVDNTRLDMAVTAEAAQALAAAITEINRDSAAVDEITRAASADAEGALAAVSRLGEASTRIGTAITLIDRIAKQTNLLALNATIEAKRAGAAGKTFVVVANEVKALAVETNRSTAEIEQLVSATQRIAEEAASAIRSIAATIAEVKRFAAGITDAVATQDQATQEIAQRAGRLADAIEAMTMMVDQVRRNMAVTQESSADMLAASQLADVEVSALNAAGTQFLELVRADA